MDGMLSQDEINALFGEDGGAVDEEQQEAVLTEEESDAIGEISNISMGTAATTLSTLVNNRVVITTPMVSYVTMEELSKQYDRPCVFINISYSAGLDGENMLIMQENDVKIITDLMMGGDGTNLDDELSELHLSAISEAMNQMMGSTATSLSSMINRKVDISPPVASVVDLNDSLIDDKVEDFLNEKLVKISFKMEVGDLVDSQIMQLFPVDFAKELYKGFIGAMEAEDAQASEVPFSEEAQAPTVAAASMQQPVQGQPMQQGGQQPMQGQPMMQPMQDPSMQGQPMMQPMMQPMQNFNIQPAQFQSFMQNVSPLIQQENIDLIMDVPLEVTVELGRSNKSIKEILEFSPGTIIELNKLAGEPIDVLVNGKFVAKGEVVVIEENFGIRVTEIIRD